MKEIWVLSGCVILLGISMILVNMSLWISSRTAKKRIDDLELRIENVSKASEARSKTLSDCISTLSGRIDEFPIEQINSIYDSEKQFQDGLNSILGYFGPVKGEHRE